MTETQLALQQLTVTGVALHLARAMVVVGIFRVQENFPEVLTHLVQFGAVVAEGLTEVVVAENHPLADHVLHIQVIRHRAHHVRPEAFAFEQRQFDQLAASDVVDAENHRFIVVLLGRQTQHHPQVLVAAVDVRQFDFQFQLLLLLQDGVEHLIADGALAVWMAVDQQLPGVLARIDIEQLQRNLVDLGDAQFLQQLLALRRLVEPGLELVAGLDLRLVEHLLQAGQVQHTNATPVPSKMS